MGLDRQ